MQGLNDRQQALYEYLLTKAKNNEWVKRVQILQDLKSAYGYNGDILYYSSAAHALTEDIQKLNYNPNIEKIIIYSADKGIKIANKEEANSFLANNLKSVLMKLDRHQIMQRKVDRDGQLSFQNDRVKQIKSFISR